MARILIAASEPVLPQLSAALAGYELFGTTTMQQAERLVLEDGINLFVVGVHFDDSRALELVKLIRLDPKQKETPILVIRLTPSTMADFIRQTMDTMKSLRVISDYLELEGDPIADVKIIDAAAEYLRSAKKVLPRSRMTTNQWGRVDSVAVVG